MVKRLFDIFCSTMGLILLSPLFFWIAWCIHRDDGGPVFYRGERVGKGGHAFRIFKFRTMVVDAETMGGFSASDHDQRITRIGRTLRKHKLDELPQLFNVLLGEMSLVGPRPEVKFYTDMFTEEEKAILDMRPGITDWASIWNNDQGSSLTGAKDPDQAYFKMIRPTKIKLQLKYIHESCLLTDLKIILLTLAALVRPQIPVVCEIKKKLAEMA